jgi:aspartyl-tRNA(Asn)/glutamyl-tRNA(Gln) amidotransferase subunit A
VRSRIRITRDLAFSQAVWSRRFLIKAGISGGAYALLNGAKLLGDSAGDQLSRSGGGPTSELTELSISEAADFMRRRKVSPLDLTRACLERIDRFNPLINAFITVTAEAALAQAREAEVEIKRGKWRGPLHGIPVGLKDNIDTAGTRTTAASAVFADRMPTEDAEVVRRLRAAGAVLVGKQNLDEFAFGHTSTLSSFGPVRNPWKRDRISGGSSGGSAAAVAARLCFGALGTDTGGSVRTPAAYCGVVGLRPTPGAVSRRGVVPLSWTLDQVGPIGRRVADVALLLSAVAGYDPEETDTVSVPKIDYVRAPATKVSSLRIGTASAMLSAIADADVQGPTREAIGVIRSITANVRDVELPSIPETTFGTILLAEAYVFHAPLLGKTPERYNPAVRMRAGLGRTITAARYIEATRELIQIRRAARQVFSDVDLVVAPTAYVSAPTIEQSNKQQEGPPPPLPPPLPTVDFSVYGLPTLSLPCGFTKSGVPVGIQIAGPPLGEATVFALAQAYERVTEWYRRVPTF